MNNNFDNENQQPMDQNQKDYLESSIQTGTYVAPLVDDNDDVNTNAHIELEVIKQKLIESTDKSSAFQIQEENLSSIDFAEVIYKFCPYKTPIELAQALNQGDVEFSCFLSQLENPRWTPAKTSYQEYDAFGQPISNSLSQKLKVDASNWDTIFSSLEREAEVEEADTGDWTLKVGFPNIIGYWQDKDGTYTTFNAPLVFAPVKIQYISIDEVKISIKGKSFDINPAIATIVSIKKKMLFESKIFGPTEQLNLEKVVKGYANLGIVFDTSAFSNQFDRCKFLSKQEIVGAFKGYEGSSFLTPSITIGLYDIYSNQIFWDFNTIINKDPEGLAKLLEPKTNLMFNYKKFSDDFRTNDIYLFSMIDIVQQLCVGRALAGNTLIQGPPGTGKSETICNILVNIALNNKTALVVSSKKTALDVIINRLGDYSPIACHMVTKRKDVEYFYAQFERLYKRFIEIRAAMEDDAVEEVVNRATTEKLFEDIYTDYQISNKLYLTKVQFGPKDYTIKQLVEIADPNDVVLLEQNNIKTRADIMQFVQKYVGEDSAENSINNLLNSFNAYSSQLNKDIQVNLGYIQQLADFLTYYNGYDKRIIVAAYIMDNQAVDFEEYDMLNRILNEDKPISDYAEQLTSKQKAWLEACKKIDMDQFIRVIESYYNVVNETNSKSQVSTDLRLFASWYIFVNNEIKGYLHEFSAKESKIEEKTEVYLDRLEESIYETKQLINRLIFTKFIDTVKKFGNEFNTVMRQRTAFNPKPSAAVIKQYFELFRNLYPIHVVSVEDVSNLIPCEKAMYDYYVCDEASQVELERALPSMYRGAKYVISGDTKQLQPSSVFKQKVEIKTKVANDSKYAQDLADAVKAPSIMQYYESRASTNVMLNYHYRSTFSELIDFSNQVFYNRQLKLVSKCVPFQNPILIHRVNGTWANSSNIEESNAIYARIVELTQTPDFEKSLGIITFNATQQAVIKERLLKSSNPRVKEWMERKSDEGNDISIFVQNIENVQGDERDIILFSIGYDRTVSNYGSLTTQADGPNRINVAITRARDRIELFQSEDANMYKGTSSIAKGPKVFTSWIRWASNMSYACANKQIYNQVPNFVSRIHQEIYNFIRSKLTAEYNVIYNQMQGTFFVNFAIYKDVTPVAAIFTQKDNWKSAGKFREEYIYRKLFFRNRRWLTLDLSELAWQVDNNYKNKYLSKFLDKVLMIDQNRELSTKYSDSVNVDMEMEDIFDKPMVEVDLNMNEMQSDDEQNNQNQTR